jgi:hypothetical protein
MLAVASAPTMFFFIGAVASGEGAFIGGFFASLFAIAATCVGATIAHRSEEKRTAKRVEWLRDRLTRALNRGRDDLG